MIRFYQYSNCTTCKKAAKFLQDYGVSFEPIDIVQHTPTYSELKEIVESSDLDVNKFFNTHGAKSVSYTHLRAHEKSQLDLTNNNIKMYGLTKR